MSTMFQRTEHKILATLAGLLGLNTVFFIVREIEPLNFLVITQDTHIFYLIYAALGIMTAGTIAFYAESVRWREWITKKLLVFFPTAFLLIFGLFESKHFHYIFQIFVGFYIITAGLVLISLYHTTIAKTRKETAPLGARQWFRKQKTATLVLLTLLVAVNLGFGTYRIAQFAAVDEALWTFGKRISKYWNNISEREWSKTTVSDKPGVTVAIISGAGLIFEDPKDFKPVKSTGTTLHPKDDITKMNFALRFPILLFTSLMLPVFYFFLERLFGRRKALISTILIGTSPILLGMARIINPDSILWVFAPLSMISYLAFLKRRNLHYLYWTGIFLGLALLTKYVANILFIFFFALIFLEYLLTDKETRKTLDFSDYMKQSFLRYAIITFIALAVFYIPYPAAWVKPSKLLNATLLSQAFESTWPLFIGCLSFILIDQWALKNRVTKGILDAIADKKQWLSVVILSLFSASVLFAIVNTLGHMQWYNFPEILASPKSSYLTAGFTGVFLTNFYPLLFGIHPLALIAIIALTFFLYKNSKQLTHTYQSSLYLILFILLYYLGTTINHVATIFRYQIMLFPIILILAGIALATFFRIAEKQYPRISFNVSALITLIIAASSLWLSSPLHLGYASGLLPHRYHIDIKDMGTGSYEAAAFLNTLPDAKNITIWSDKNGVCTFFVGNCYSSFNFSNLKNKGIDYVVVSSGRQSRTAKMIQGSISSGKQNIIPFDTYYTKTEGIAYTLEIDHRPSNFIKVISF
ncbi:MAG: glycosyltransferase family 39 protein [Candidatus Moranbacteria bacterium]|nr:glycosyltransferase family 39 protein [Candidatus Moranbacteria bacterium]